MSERLAEAILRYTNGRAGQGVFGTAIEAMHILRSDHPKPPAHLLFRPVICIVAQGAKWATFAENRLEYRAGEALLVGIDTPSIGCVVEASPGKPCLVLAVALDPAVIRSVAEGINTLPTPSTDTGRGVFVTNFQGPLADCALRLVRLLETPEAIPTLYPVIMREICYWLLTGPHGGDVVRMTLPNGSSQRVTGAIQSLQNRFRQTVRVDELAAVAQMSPSAFHRQFKALTSWTPLQYQKQLRLLEARRLMISCAMSGEAASFAVGYESASQFSREYARMFGAPPKRDAKQMQTMFRAGGASAGAEPIVEHA